MKILSVVLVLLCAVTLLAGCHAARILRPPFNVAVKNVGSRDIKVVAIQFPGFSDSGSQLRPGISGQYSMIAADWPAEAKIKWRFANDRAYMPDREAVVTIPVRPVQRQYDDLTLWFDLDGEGVKVRTELYDESEIIERVNKFEREKAAKKREQRD